MNYSQEWQDKLNLHNSLPQVLDWETTIAKKYVDLNHSKATNLIFLNNPVLIRLEKLRLFLNIMFILTEPTKIAQTLVP